MIEKIRAGGAGIPAFYCHTGAGTHLESGEIPVLYKDGKPFKFNQKRETRFFNDKKYLLETSLSADFSFVKCEKADKAGNL